MTTGRDAGDGRRAGGKTGRPGRPDARRAPRKASQAENIAPEEGAGTADAAGAAENAAASEPSVKRVAARRGGAPSAPAPVRHVAPAAPRKAAGRREASSAEVGPAELEVAPPVQLPATIEPPVPAVRAADTPEKESGFAQLDRYFHALMGRGEGGLSPLSLGMAWADWMTHLALSPGRQAELLVKGLRDAQRLAAWSVASVLDDAPGAPPVAPDRRFAAPEWAKPPFSTLAQAHLLAERGWKRALGDFRGVDAHHLRLVDFYGRQMFDMLSPSNFLATNPQLIARTVEEGGANLVRGAQYWAEDNLRRMMGVEAPSADFTPGVEVAATPGQVVLRNRLIELIQYHPSTETVSPVPLLIVPAWIMKYYILDLTAVDSLVKWLVDQGFTVFCISWKNPGPEDRDLGFDDYRTLGVMAALDAVTAITGAPKVQALGYCLGGTLLSVAAAAMARDGDHRLASMSMLAAQVDFTEAGELSLFTNEDQLALLEDMMWVQGGLGKEAMAGTFSMLKSQDLIWSRLVREYVMGERELPSALSAWSDDATRMPYRMHSEYLRWLFLDNDLAEGRMSAGGGRIFLQDIKVPVFAVATEHDHIAPWTSVYKLTWLLRAPVTFALASGGHNTGIVAAPGNPKAKFRMMAHVPGRLHPGPTEWAAATAPQAGSWWHAWAEWLREQDRAEPVAPPPMGRADAGYGVLEPAPGQYVMVR